MDRDSEVETVLADDDWYRGEAWSRPDHSDVVRRRVQQQQQVEDENEVNIDNEELGEGFDEEDLFSTTGSLSSLHEFSDSDGDHPSASNYEEEKSKNAVNPKSHWSSFGVHSNNTESEIDVEGDYTRTPIKIPKHKPRAMSTTVGGSSTSPLVGWKVRRGRKVIVDEDDYDDRVSNADVEDEAGDGNKRQNKKKLAENGPQRRHSLLTHKKADGNTSASSAGGSALLRHRKHKRESSSSHHHSSSSSKRRRVRYDLPDYVDEDGCPQLVYFASKGDATTCRKLLSRGAHVDITDSHGWTALHEATKNSHMDALEVLLSPPIRGKSSLHSTSDGGALDRQDSDIGSGTNSLCGSRMDRQLQSPLPNVSPTTLQSHLTPLHQAVMNKNVQVVRMLLSHGANTSKVNIRKLTPLDICADEQIARLLSEHSKTQRMISVRDKAGQAKLHRACNAGDLDLVVALINQGADINMKDNAGWTPLHEASLEGHGMVVLELLRRGADYNARGFGGDTPLHDACANGHVDVVKCLLLIGSSPLLKNSKGITPLDMAQEEDQEDVIKVIDQYQQETRMQSTASSMVRKDKRSMSATLKRPPPGISGLGVNALDTTQKRKPKTRPESHSRSPAAGSIDEDGNSRRELSSLKRLREEAEKPEVNYYYTSANPEKLSRDERKLQALMGTIERMEKRQNKDGRRRPSAPATTTTVRDTKEEPVRKRTKMENDVPVKPKQRHSRKQQPINEGKTIVEEKQPQKGHTISMASVAAQAIRYLPLYTIQLHGDPPTSKLDYMVVDLQVRLLLGMPIETLGQNKDADEPEALSNPLFVAYPHLFRQRITKAQKERLWKPLAGMFATNMQFIHDSSSSVVNTEFPTSSPPDKTDIVDGNLVRQFTLHEKQKFVGLQLYFVKLDEVVNIIRQDFPLISKQLITISLDLSTISNDKSFSQLSSMPPRLAATATAIPSVEKCTSNDDICPKWNGPQKMLPLRYALKLHYRDKQAFLQKNNN